MAEHLAALHRHLLAPMVADEPPPTIDAAIVTFLSRREDLERRFQVAVPRALEDEVRRGVWRLGLAA